MYLKALLLWGGTTIIKKLGTIYIGRDKLITFILAKEREGDSRYDYDKRHKELSNIPSNRLVSMYKMLYKLDENVVWYDVLGEK